MRHAIFITVAKLDLTSTLEKPGNQGNKRTHHQQINILLRDCLTKT